MTAQNFRVLRVQLDKVQMFVMGTEFDASFFWKAIWWLFNTEILISETL